MLWSGLNLDTWQTWDTMTGATKPPWDKNHTFWWWPQGSNHHPAKIWRNILLGSLHSTWWHNENNGNATMEKGSALHSSIAMNSHVTLQSWHHLLLLLSLSANIPLPSNLAFHTVSRPHPLAVHCNNFKQDGTTPYATKKYGFHPMQHGRSQTLQPHPWTRSTAGHNPDPTPPCRLNAWPNTGAPHPNIPIMGQNMRPCPLRHATMSLDSWPLALLCTRLYA